MYRSICFERKCITLFSMTIKEIKWIHIYMYLNFLNKVLVRGEPLVNKI